MLGLPRGEVFLVPWTNEWITEFETEKQHIQDLIGPYIHRVHHIGSTAIEGLCSKPIIDIAVEIHDFSDGEKCASALEKIGYAYRGTIVLPERHYFNKGEPRTHQIHMYETGNRYLAEQLKFRDYLRRNEQQRKEYEQLKLALAHSNSKDKHKYAEEKTEFVKAILEKG
ncbi:GrpB family protein [Metabacillus indicus]|uniref:GrpB family protein n=1 Tax=Metabacillus indicus TaxID=246786 RepID=UPI003CF5330D